MSTKAYLIKEIKLAKNLYEIKIKKILENEPTLNITRNNDIFELFRKYGDDSTNEDCLGEISISKEEWNEADFKNIKEKEIIEKINTHIENSDGYVIYECV